MAEMSTTAIAKVFATTELLEHVLLFLTPKEIYHLQRVSQKFRAVIRHSPIVARAVFLRPTSEVTALKDVADVLGFGLTPAKEPYFIRAEEVWNPFIEPLFTHWFEEGLFRTISHVGAKRKLPDGLKREPRKTLLEKLHLKSPSPLAQPYIDQIRLRAALEASIFVETKSSRTPDILLPSLWIRPDCLAGLRLILKELPQALFQMYLTKAVAPIMLRCVYWAKTKPGLLRTAECRARGVLVKPCSVGQMIRIAVKMALRDEQLERIMYTGFKKWNIMDGWMLENEFQRWEEGDGFTPDERLLMMSNVRQYAYRSDGRPYYQGSVLSAVV